MPLTFLDLHKQLFKRFSEIDNYIRLINKVIKSCINPKFLIIHTLWALDLAKKEDKENNKYNIGEDSKLELA